MVENPIFRKKPSSLQVQIATLHGKNASGNLCEKPVVNGLAFPRSQGSSKFSLVIHGLSPVDVPRSG